MSGLLTISVAEANGYVAVNAARANIAVVMGCSSAGSGLSPFYLSGDSAIAGLGYGDAVDDLTQIIEQRQANGNGTKRPAAFCTTPVTTTGAYGTIDVSGVTGTAKVAVHSATHPLGTYAARIKVIGGGAIGTAGITYQTSLDGGFTYGNTTALGTATTVTIANSGVQFDLGMALKGTADVSQGALYGGGATLDTKTLILNVNGGGATTLTLNGATNTANEAAFLAAIAATWPALVATDTGAGDGHKLLLTNNPGTTIVVGAGTANAALGLTAGTYSGTLVAGDLVKVRTTPPAPSVTDIDTAFTALANSSIDFGVLVLGFDLNSTNFAHITTGLNALKATGKRPFVIGKARLPNFESAESDAAWNASIAADFANLNDSRVHYRATYGLLTDAMTSRIYLRTDMAQFAADCVRVDRFVYMGSPADQPIANWSLVTPRDNEGVLAGTTVGHDEGPRGASTGLSDDVLGNRFGCNMRMPSAGQRENVYNTVPWVSYASNEQIRNVMVRRSCDEQELEALSAGVLKLGGKVFVKKVGNNYFLSDTSREAIQAAMRQPLATEFTEVDNREDASLDTGYVQIAQGVTVTGGNLAHATYTLAPRFGDFLVELKGTLAIQL